MKTTIIRRTIHVGHRTTSVSLEEQFWNALKEIAGRDKMTLTALAHHIDRKRGRGNLSSAIRLFVLEDYLSRAPAPKPHSQKSKSSHR